MMYPSESLGSNFNELIPISACVEPDEQSDTTPETFAHFRILGLPRWLAMTGGRSR
jgi:hypothetical protein